MKQSSFRYLGVIDLLLIMGLTAVLGPSALITLPVVLMSLAGILAIGAGTVTELSVGPLSVSWRHLVGTSYLAFALLWPALYAPAVIAPSGSRMDLLLFAVTTAGALMVAFVGFDIARDGPHFSVTPDVERTIAL